MNKNEGSHIAHQRAQRHFHLYEKIKTTKYSFTWLRFTIVSLRCSDVEKLSHTPRATIKAEWILRALWKQTSAYAPHGFIVIVYFNVILLTMAAFLSFISFQMQRVPWDIAFIFIPLLLDCIYYSQVFLARFVFIRIDSTMNMLRTHKMWRTFVDSMVNRYRILHKILARF